MTWWQTLLVAVVPVLFTLIITNVADERRRRDDSKERQTDRGLALQASRDERVRQLEDVHRAERIDVYRKMLIRAEAAILELESTILASAFAATIPAIAEMRGVSVEDLVADNPIGTAEYARDHVGVSQEMQNGLRHLNSEIALLGGKDARARSKDLHDAIQAAHKRVVRAHEDGKAIEIGSVDAFALPLYRARESLAEAARVEIGANPPPEIRPVVDSSTG